MLGRSLERIAAAMLCGGHLRESSGVARSMMFGVPAVSSLLSGEKGELSRALRLQHCWPALYPPSIRPRSKGNATSEDYFCVIMNQWRFPVVGSRLKGSRVEGPARKSRCGAAAP